MHKTFFITVASVLMLGVFAFAHLAYAATYGSGLSGSGLYGSGGDTTAPSVSITTPSAGTVSGASVTFSTTASDNVGVSGVQFKVDSSNVGAEDTSSAYSVNWDTTTVSDGSHTLTAVARDAAGNTTTSNGVVVTVDNTAPVRSALAPAGNLTAGTTSTNLTLTTNEAATCKYSTNPATAYASMPSTFSTTGGTSHSTTVIGLTNGSSYTYYVRCSDARSNVNTSGVAITFSVNTPGNVAPTADAGDDDSVRLPTSSIALSGSGTDSDGSIASYAWTQISGATATIATAATATTSITGMTTAGTYVFRLTITDNSGASDTDDVSVTVNPESSGGGGGGGGSLSSSSSTPSVNAGADQDIILPTSSTTLSGIASVNSGTISAYEWSQIRGTSVKIVNPTSAATTITGLTSTGTYTFELEVTTSAGKKNTDTVSITVQPAGTTVTIPTGCTASTLFSPVNGQECSAISTTIPTSSSGSSIPTSSTISTISTISTSSSSSSSSSISSTPSSSSTPSAFLTSLLLGSRSEEVKKLQAYLNTHNSPVALTGTGSLGNETNYFGPATKAAVIKLQMANGIVPASGYFGPLTRAIINGGATVTTPTIPPVITSTGCTASTLFSPVNGQKCSAISTTIPTTPSSSPSAFLTSLLLGSRSEEVKKLQAYLNTHNSPVALTGTGSLGNETNYFGPATKAAVIKLQMANGIVPASGYFGPLTRAIINGGATVTTPTIPPVITIGTVTALPLNLNVRVFPINGVIIGTVPRGTTGTITAGATGWSKVKFTTGLEGWVHQSLIK